jgi:hypothetical protein
MVAQVLRDLLHGGISDSPLAAIHHGLNLQRPTAGIRHSLALVEPHQVSLGSAVAVGTRPYTQAIGRLTCRKNSWGNN